MEQVPRQPVRRLRSRLHLALALGLTLAVGAATFRPATLLRDINTVPQPLDSRPAILCTATNFTLLTSEEPTYGFRLWATNGTSAGTVQIARLQTDSGLGSFSCLSTATPGLAYFQVNVDGTPEELWRSDGTAAGTYRLFRGSSQGAGFALVGTLRELTVFAANPESGDSEIYRTDGTLAGTQLLRDLTPGPDASLVETPGLVLAGRLLFKANGDLWSTDGTTAGTLPVLDLQPSTDTPDFGPMVPVGGGAVFARASSTDETELWFTDGTTNGSRLIASSTLTPGLVYISSLSPAGPTRAVFSVPDVADPFSRSVWTTDGTTGGTGLLLPSQPDLLVWGGFTSLPEGAAFIGLSGSDGALWFTDGTESGTRMVHNPWPGENEFWVGDTARAGRGLFYETFSATRELWFSDGTAPGTWSVTAANAQYAADYSSGTPLVHGDEYYVLSQVTPTTGSSDRISLWRGSIVARSLARAQDFLSLDTGPFGLLHNGQVLFTNNVAPYGSEPWTWDVAAGARLLKDLEPARTNGWSEPAFAFSLQGQAFFAANDGVQGAGLWRSDGTAAGTTRVAAGAPAAFTGRMPAGLLGTQVLYAGLNSEGVAELWRTDGTPAGTSLVLDLSGRPVLYPSTVGSSPGSCGAGFVRSGDALFYGAAPLGVGKLFRSNGTAAGTLELGSFPGDPASSPFSYAQSRVCALAELGGFIYFEALDPVSRLPVLWLNNGTAGGNTQVRTPGGTAIRAPLEMLVMNGALYFFSNTEGQMSLWRVTPGGSTAQLQFSRSWAHDTSYPALNAVLGSTLLFRDCELPAGSSVTVCRQYRTDGTSAGTTALSTAEPTRQPGSRSTARLGNRLVYAGLRDQTGFDLWVTDGTVAGSTSIRVAAAGAAYMPVAEFVDFNGVVYFSFEVLTNNGTAVELWRTDGTAAGTQRANALPIVGTYLPGADFVATGQRLLFAGQSDTEGMELWSIENEAPIAQADNGSTTSPASVTIDVLANDSDPDGELARSTIRITRAAANGTAVADGVAGNVRYTPAAGFSGNDTFEYTIADAQGREAAAVTVTVAVAAAPGGGGGGSGGGTGGGSSGGGGGRLDLVTLLALAGVVARFARSRQRWRP